MRLTIIAATGGIGRHLLQQAQAAGHEVTVVVRDPAKLDGNARVITADLASPNTHALAAAVHDADAVLSGLGATSRRDAGIAARGTAAIIAAMRATTARRLAVVSASPIASLPPHSPSDADDDWLARALLNPPVKRIFRAVYADLAAMEAELRDSDLDWTVVRPPRLINRPRTGRYRTAVGRNVRGGRMIGRADVADYMLTLLGLSETLRQPVGIAY